MVWLEIFWRVSGNDPIGVPHHVVELVSFAPFRRLY